MAHAQRADTANRISFAEAFRFWLKLGFISFGGPAGQIAVRIGIDWPVWSSLDWRAAVLTVTSIGAL